MDRLVRGSSSLLGRTGKSPVLQRGFFVLRPDRRTKADTGRIITALGTKLAEFPGNDDLANADAWL